MGSPSINENPVKNRLGRFRKRLKALELDGYCVWKRVNVRYLSGFRNEDAALLITPDDVILITDFRYTEQARIEAPLCEVIERDCSLAESVAKHARKAGVSRLGFESDCVPHAVFEDMRHNCGKTKLVPGRRVIEEVRQIKEQEEVEAIRRAILLGQRAFKRVFLDSDWSGMTEFEMVNALEFEMRSLGAECAAFDTICAVDEGASQPHHQCLKKKPGKTSSLLVDWGARLDGYCGDLTRILFRRTIAPELKGIYQVALDAQKLALEAIRPGVTGASIDRVARSHIESKGYGREFGHGLGHGLGMEVHELPSVNAAGKVRLKPGMVFTVEPGIYLAGRMGVRIEDVVVVTKDGCRILSSLPKTLQSATLA